MARKKLQLALDMLSLEEGLAFLEQVAGYIDIIEIGTPLIVSEGARSIRMIKEHYPDLLVFADIKVMDGGKFVPLSVIDAGCDLFSVLCAAENETLESAIQLAHRNSVQVIADLCGVRDVQSRAREVAQMSPDYLCCHVGIDMQQTGANPVAEAEAVAQMGIPLAIAGGIRMETFAEAIASPAEIIICGNGLCHADNPADTAKQMHEMLHAYNSEHHLTL